MIANIGTKCTWNNKSKDSKRIKNQSPCFCGIKDVSMFTKEIRRLEDKLLVWQSFLSTFQRRKSNSNSFVEMEVAITNERKKNTICCIDENAWAFLCYVVQYVSICEEGFKKHSRLILMVS